MIFVAVGTQKFPLNRLLRHIDEMINKGIINEDVFAQTGHSDYQPMHYLFKPFLSKEEFEDKITECDILITHSGVGTIMSGIKNEKKIIVYPRLSKYGEHVDDHQLEIAKSFAEKNFVLICGENEDLENVLYQTREHIFSAYESKRDRVVNEIRGFINLL